MTSVTIRPNTTGIAPDSVTGAANAAAATSDNSDASYATDAELWTVGFGTVSPSAGSVYKSFKLRWRARSVADTLTVNGKLRYQPASGGGAYSTLVSAYSGLGTTIGNYGTAEKAQTLTQSQVDGLVARFETYYAESYRTMEVYVDVVYVTKPSTTVTAVSPDPYTASTLVPIEWTNTFDTDGGTQTRYQVRVFTDAQYGAGGFDPATSDAYYDTGVVISSSTTVDVGPLENADTYRAYVRVAQTVNGALHWSDYAFDQFTMNVVTSEVGTVTVAADNATASIDVTVAWDSGSAAWERIDLQRSDDGGTTWAYVRGGYYIETTDGGATDMVVTDYEAPNTTTVQYRARAWYQLTGLDVAGSWVTSSTTSWTETAEVWVKAPADPTLNYKLCLWQVPTERTTMRQGVFDVLGSANPVVVSDTRSGTAGQISFYVESTADADALQALLEQPVLLIQPPTTLNVRFSYIAAGQVERQRVPRPVIDEEAWVVSYIAVDQPPVVSGEAA